MGKLRGSLRRFAGPSGSFETGRGCRDAVWNRSEETGTGLVTLGKVRDGTVAFVKVRDWSGDPRGGLGRVEEPRGGPGSVAGPSG